MMIVNQQKEYLVSFLLLSPIHSQELITTIMNKVTTSAWRLRNVQTTFNHNYRIHASKFRKQDKNRLHCLCSSPINSPRLSSINMKTLFIIASKSADLERKGLIFRKHQLTPSSEIFLNQFISTFMTSLLISSSLFNYLPSKNAIIIFNQLLLPQVRRSGFYAAKYQCILYYFWMDQINKQFETLSIAVDILYRDVVNTPISLSFLKRLARYINIDLRQIVRKNIAIGNSQPTHPIKIIYTNLLILSTKILCKMPRMVILKVVLQHSKFDSISMREIESEDADIQLCKDMIEEMIASVATACFPPGEPTDLQTILLKSQIDRRKFIAQMERKLRQRYYDAHSVLQELSMAIQRQDEPLIHNKTVENQISESAEDALNFII